MKDRRFMVMLGLVIAAGLVMGLIAFRMTGGQAPAPTTANGAVANDGQPHPSAADGEVASSDQAGDAPQATDMGTKNAEPTVPSKEPPAMQGPANGDPPGTAAVATPPPSADAAPAASDTPQ